MHVPGVVPALPFAWWNMQVLACVSGVGSMHTLLAGPAGLKLVLAKMNEKASQGWATWLPSFRPEIFSAAT